MDIKVQKQIVSNQSSMNFDNQKQTHTREVKDFKHQLEQFQQWLGEFTNFKTNVVALTQLFLEGQTSQLIDQPICSWIDGMRRCNLLNIQKLLEHQFKWIVLLEPPTKANIDKITSQISKEVQRHNQKTTSMNKQINEYAKNLGNSKLNIQQMKTEADTPKSSETMEEVTIQTQRPKYKFVCSQQVNLDVYPPESLDQVRQRVTKSAKQISMNNNHLGNGLCQVIRLANPLELSYLSLENNQIDSEGIKILAQCNFEKLTSLYLANNKIMNGLVFRKGNWSSLQALSLTNNSITSKGLVSFGSYFKDLNYLSLRHNPIGDAGLHIILSDNLQNLQILHLQRCSISNSAMFLTVDKKQPIQLKRLEKLYLQQNNISDKALSSLLSSSLVQTIKLLHLQQNNLKASDMELFVKQQQNLSGLTNLDLSENKITQKGIEHFSAISLKSLQRLIIRSNELDICKCFKQLAKADLPSIVCLQLDENKYDEKNQAAIKTTLQKTFFQRGRYIRIIYKRLMAF